MKIILGILIMSLSLTSHALTCTSMADNEKKIEVTKLEGNASLLEISEGELTTYLLGTSKEDIFGFSFSYKLFSQSGESYSFSVSQATHHCRARICPPRPNQPKVGVLTTSEQKNEFFDCL